MLGFNVILAHQGGWDELLLVAAPVAVFVLLLRFANQRAAKLSDTTQARSESTSPNLRRGIVPPRDQPGSGFDDDAPADD